MVRSVIEICGYRIEARDGEIGAVEDFLFDDVSWKIRYVVASTRKWWPGRSVLVAPSAMGQTDWLKKSIHIDMTKQQIKEGEEIEAHEPVSRQETHRVNIVGGWPVMGAQLMGTQPVLVGGPVATPESDVAVEEAAQGDPHLRSVKEVVGYHIEARDGSIGHVEDFVADERDWTIRYAVVDTRNWLAGRKVLIAPWMIRRVAWSDRSVFVDLTRKQVENSPEFDPDAPVNRAYEEVYYDYYGRPVYW